MKKKFLPICSLLLFFSSSSFAQFQKGDKLLGFGLNFQSSTNEINSGFIPQTNKSTGYGLSVELGFALKENRLNGFFISGNYGLSKNEFPSQPITNSKSDYFNVGAGYFTRRYKSIGKSFFVFGEGRVGFNYAGQNNPGINANKSKSYGVNAGIYPGIAYKLNNRFFLELKLADFVNVGYSQQETTTNPNNKKDIQRNFSLGSSLGLGYLRDFGIGARWIIPSKKK
jgi:hypothetical protein